MISSSKPRIRNLERKSASVGKHSDSFQELPKQSKPSDCFQTQTLTFPTEVLCPHPISSMYIMCLNGGGETETNNSLSLPSLCCFTRTSSHSGSPSKPNETSQEIIPGNESPEVALQDSDAGKQSCMVSLKLFSAHFRLTKQTAVWWFVCFVIHKSVRGGAKWQYYSNPACWSPWRPKMGTLKA